MGVNEGHTQIDDLNDKINDLQKQKLSLDTWGDRDTFIEDLANRTIDDFQDSIKNGELELGDQKEALQRLVDFLNDLGGELEGIDGLTEVLQADDGMENVSLSNGMPSLEAQYSMGGELEYVLRDIDYIVNSGKSQREMMEDLADVLKHRGNKMGGEVTPKMQTDLDNKTNRVYDTFIEKTGISREMLESYMVFGPKLLTDLQSEKVQNYYSNPDNKRAMLEGLSTQEEQMYVIKIWDFMSLEPKQQKQELSNNSSFANNLRQYGVSEPMEAVEIYSFSQSPEVITKKTEIFDMIAEKCDGEELEQVIAIYQVYLEYAGESSTDIDSYLTKLSLFQDMLEDEFDGAWNIGLFIERLITTAGTVTKNLTGSLKMSKIIKKLGELRRLKEYITNFNALESSLFAASFCPYAGDALDICYGAYKFENGVNFSGEEVSSMDARTQMTFGCIGLGINCIWPAGGTLVKNFLKGALEINVVKVIMEKITKFMPTILKILEKFKEDTLSGIKELKDFFVNNILPTITGEMKQIIALVK